MLILPFKVEAFIYATLEGPRNLILLHSNVKGGAPLMLFFEVETSLSCSLLQIRVDPYLYFLPESSHLVLLLLVWSHI